MEDEQNGDPPETGPYWRQELAQLQHPTRQGMTAPGWACLGSCGRKGILAVGCFASRGLRVRAEVRQMFRQRFEAGGLRAVACHAMPGYWYPVKKTV